MSSRRVAKGKDGRRPDDIGIFLPSKGWLEKHVEQKERDHASVLGQQSHLTLRTVARRKHDPETVFELASTPPKHPPFRFLHERSYPSVQKRMLSDGIRHQCEAYGEAATGFNG